MKFENIYLRTGGIQINDEKNNLLPIFQHNIY